MTTADATPEAVEKLKRVITDRYSSFDPLSAEGIARAVLAAGYVHLITHLNSLTAYERLELGDSLCREAARMDDEEDDR